MLQICDRPALLLMWPELLFLVVVLMPNLILAQIPSNSCTMLSIDGGNVTYSNGSLSSPNSLIQGTNASFHCNSDTPTRIGPKTLTCLGSGTWSATPSFCVAACETGSFSKQFSCSSGFCNFNVAWYATNSRLGFYLSSTLENDLWTGVGYNTDHLLNGSSWIYITNTDGLISIGATAAQGPSNSTIFQYSYASTGALTAYYMRQLSTAAPAAVYNGSGSGSVSGSNGGDPLASGGCVFLMFAPGGGNLTMPFETPTDATILPKKVCFAQCGTTTTTTTLTTTTLLPTVQTTAAIVTAATLQSSTTPSKASTIVGVYVQSPTTKITYLLFLLTVIAQ